jgi:hypothetical protein
MAPDLPSVDDATQRWAGRGPGGVQEEFGLAFGSGWPYPVPGSELVAEAKRRVAGDKDLWVVGGRRGGQRRPGLPMAEPGSPAVRSGRVHRAGPGLQQHLAGDPPGRIAQVRATTTTSSSGPITGRNSGSRSIGDSTHSLARTTAALACHGTRRATMTPAGGRWIPRTAHELGQVDLVAGAAHAPFPPGTPSTWMVGSARVGP